MFHQLRQTVVILVAFSFLMSACSKSTMKNDGSSEVPDKGMSIQIAGSDTMVNLAQAWAEEYHKKHPEVIVQVRGGGSGVGIGNLIDNLVTMATSSRKIKDKEIQKAKQKTGKEPKELIVGQDALAIYVHKDNPMESISIEELAEIYGEGGKITKWSELDIENAACAEGKISRIGRQNSSGTYYYFRETVLGHEREFKLGSIDQSGSKDVVALISRTPCAIGYSGMGYRTDEVKTLKVSAKKGGAAFEPSVTNVMNGTYPISRPLIIYTLGESTGIVKEFLDWIIAEEGQQIVQDQGYVPLNESKK